jgi:hypothetical protein
MRIRKYESVYETIESDELSYIKLINMQSKVICNRIYGNMAHLLVPFLMSIHILCEAFLACAVASFRSLTRSLTVATDRSTFVVPRTSRKSLTRPRPENWVRFWRRAPARVVSMTTAKSFPHA